MVPGGWGLQSDSGEVGLASLDLVAAFSSQSAEVLIQEVPFSSGEGCPVMSMGMQNGLCLSSSITDLSAFEKNQEGVFEGGGSDSILALQSMRMQEPW